MAAIKRPNFPLFFSFWFAVCPEATASLPVVKLQTESDEMLMKVKVRTINCF